LDRIPGSGGGAVTHRVLLVPAFSNASFRGEAPVRAAAPSRTACS
jgi:hypothetical protein